jgi:RNA polymerase sigma factor (sigma-70 family)
MDFHRKESTMVVRYSVEATLPLVANGSSAGDILVMEEEKVLLHQQISQLPSNEQEVLMLRMQQGLSYKQIAEVMELSVSHVGVLIHQAVSRLKQELANA